MDEQRLAEIEKTVAYQREHREVSWMTDAAADLCSALRAAWAERDALREALEQIREIAREALEKLR